MKLEKNFIFTLQVKNLECSHEKITNVSVIFVIPFKLVKRHAQVDLRVDANRIGPMV